MKTVRGEQQDLENDTKRRRWQNPEVVAVRTVPDRDFILSPHVRITYAHALPRETGMFAYWNKIAEPGTKVANAIGLNTFDGGDPLTLWMQQMGFVDKPTLSEEAGEFIAFGLEKEDHARKLYEQEMRVQVHRHDHQIRSSHSWLLHGCDGHARGRPDPLSMGGKESDYLIEIKCRKDRAAYATVPIHYMVQQQVGMALHDMEWCDFVVYTTRDIPVLPGKPPSSGGTQKTDHLTVMRIFRDRDLFELILSHVIYFVDCLKYGVPPHHSMKILDAQHALLGTPNVVVKTLCDRDVTLRPQ